MTVLVGVKCKNAVIIGSDSAVSSGIGGLEGAYTVEHPGQKIDIICDQIIVAGTGAKGLGQRFVGLISDAWAERVLISKSPIEVGRMIAERSVKNFATTQAPKNYGALVAFPGKHKAELCEFEYGNLQPELKTDDSWYVSMGVAQTVADTLLGLARETFWKHGPPSREDGIFAAIWVLHLTIAMYPTGVSPPIQMAVLEGKAGKDLTARCLSKDEIGQHEAHVSPLMEYIGKYRETLKMAESSASEAPSPSG